jgi:hypothetical protein
MEIAIFFFKSYTIISYKMCFIELTLSELVVSVMWHQDAMVPFTRIGDYFTLITMLTCYLLSFFISVLPWIYWEFFRGYLPFVIVEACMTNHLYSLKTEVLTTITMLFFHYISKHSNFIIKMCHGLLMWTHKIHYWSFIGTNKLYT